MKTDTERKGIEQQWRKDFPIDWPEDHFVARRDFTKFMVLTSFAFLVGQAWIVVQNWLRERRGEPAMQRIASLSDVPVGRFLLFDYPEEHDSCILVRMAEDRFVAFSQKCTHLSCAVVPELERMRFFCPCHVGAFDLESGRPIAGPPRRPLPQVRLEIVNDSIYAAGIDLRMV